MRSKLMSTVAVLALSLSGTFALAQERSPAGSPGTDKSAPADRSTGGGSRATEPKSAQTGAESPKERSPSAERATPAPSTAEPRSAGETQGE